MHDRRRRTTRRTGPPRRAARHRTGWRSWPRSARSPAAISRPMDSVDRAAVRRDEADEDWRRAERPVRPAVRRPRPPRHVDLGAGLRVNGGSASSSDASAPPLAAATPATERGRARQPPGAVHKRRSIGGTSRRGVSFNAGTPAGAAGFPASAERLVVDQPDAVDWVDGDSNARPRATSTRPASHRSATDT